MTTEDFESGAAAVGLGIIKRFVFNLSQAVYLLAPVGADIGKILPENAFHPTKSDARATAKRPLIVAGFLGRGNCGDEAIFQVIHETFTADFEIIASVDEYGAHQRFWEWYPYAASRIIHQCDLSFPLREPRLAGMLVGGGGVRMSFAADQVLAARTVGAPCAFAGTDIDDMSYLARPIDGSAIADYLGLFSYVGVRSASSVEAGRRLGRTAAHGADWALRLVTDQAADLRPEPKSVGLTLREFPLTMISYTSVREVRTLVEGLRSLGFDPYFLPFCPEDERFLDELGFRNSAPIVRSWWNPRRMKQIIACSGGILSLGRLHPLVFAASTRTPVLSVHPPIDASAVEFVMPKIATMCEELGVPSADSIGEALSVFETDGPKPSDEAKLRNSEARLEAMIEQLRQLFGVGRVAADHA